MEQQLPAGGVKGYEKLYTINAELRTDEHGNLQLVSKDGSNVFGENHVQLTPQSFLDKTFAPILKVSGSPKPAATQQRPMPTNNLPVNEGAEANNQFVRSHTDQVLADMAMPKPTMM